MSEELNPKQLPHEMLMSRYGLSMEQMGKHTKQLKTDLDRTLRLVLNKAKNGAVNLTPATQSKIETYDRYICDGIFEYLEAQETISSDKVDTLEKQADDKREQVKEQMEDMHDEANRDSSDTSSSVNDETNNGNIDNKDNPSQEKKAIIGFWTWK